jgi:hypothetical protein
LSAVLSLATETCARTSDNNEKDSKVLRGDKDTSPRESGNNEKESRFWHDEKEASTKKMITKTTNLCDGEETSRDERETSTRKSDWNEKEGSKLCVTRRVNFQLFLCDGNFRWKR